MNTSDYAILYALYKDKITCSLAGYTIRQLQDKTNYSNTKVRNALKLLNQANYTCTGAYNGNAKTYYITENGISKILEIDKEMRILGEPEGE